MKNKINSIWENFPITVKVTLWYTFFTVALIFVLLTASFAIADKMTGDVNQRELTGIVNEMASDMNLMNLMTEFILSDTITKE